MITKHKGGKPSVCEAADNPGLSLFEIENSKLIAHLLDEAFNDVIDGASITVVQQQEEQKWWLQLNRSCTCSKIDFLLGRLKCDATVVDEEVTLDETLQ